MRDGVIAVRRHVNSIIREEIDQPRKTAKKEPQHMSHRAAKPPLSVKLAQPAPALRYGPTGDALRPCGLGSSAMMPKEDIPMSITHYRVVTRAHFFDTIGVDEMGLHRLPHSPVATVDLIFRDREGREIGRQEWRYDPDGDAIPHTQQFPAAAPDQLDRTITLWL